MIAINKGFFYLRIIAMSMPAGLAKPTLVTGKTNESKVIDVYAADPNVQTKSVQNKIVSALSMIGGTSGLSNILTGSNLSTGISSLVKKAITGDLDKDGVRESLSNYKDGVLSGILESNGYDSSILKGDIVDNVANNIKDLAFNDVSKIVNNVAPGLLEDIHITSFDDVKETYDQTKRAIEGLKDFNSHDLQMIIGENLESVHTISSEVLYGCVDVINGILAPEVKITDINDVDINNAVMSSAALPLIENDNPTINDYLLSAFGTNTDSRDKFINSTVNKAISSGSYKYINSATALTSKENIGWISNDDKDSFLSNIRIPIDDAPTNESDRLFKEEELLSAVEAVTGVDRSEFDAGTFKNVSESVYNVLKHGAYGVLASIGKNSKELTASEIMENNFKDYL